MVDYRHSAGLTSFPRTRESRGLGGSFPSFPIMGIIVEFRASHASPSRGEGEVGLPPLRFAKGDALSVAMRRGMHGCRASPPSFREPYVIPADAGIHERWGSFPSFPIMGIIVRFRASPACEGGFETRPYVASPSRGEGEVGFPPLRFAKGDALSVARRRGMHGGCGILLAKWLV